MWNISRINRSFDTFYNYTVLVSGFSTGVENMEEGSSIFDGGLESLHGVHGGLKTAL